MKLEVDLERVCLADKAVHAELLAEQSGDGNWIGQLPSSPLATAAAISALVVAHRSDADALRDTSPIGGELVENVIQCDLSELLVESVHWLARHQNPDGGWGDCDRAPSNIAATLLVQAAFRLTGIPAKYANLMARADDYVEAQGPAGLWRKYGNDRTLVAAILANCALAGMLPWAKVPTLRYELACLPQRIQPHFQLPVARYGIPLLLAAGRAKLYHDPPRNPFTRLVRRSFRAKSLAILNRMQAADGSFADSIPLTSFVVMFLASADCQKTSVVERGLEFLLSSVRADASWPIENHQATRITSLALANLAIRSPAPAQAAKATALQAGPVRRNGQADFASSADTASIADLIADTAAIEIARHAPSAGETENGEDAPMPDQRCLSWLLRVQHDDLHPITGVPPGGWARSDAAGALPNAFDTASALIALAAWRHRATPLQSDALARAAERGVAWLLDVQHDAGGWPTFYRDARPAIDDPSCSDATAQALRAIFAWRRQWESPDRRDLLPGAPAGVAVRIDPAIERGIEFLQSHQQADGSFIPQWFGNVHDPDEHNPVIGTAQVTQLCSELGLLETEMALRAARWLISAQHANGGWGPPRAPLDYSASEKDGSRTWRDNDAMAKFATVEETAAAVSALLPLAKTNPTCARAVSNGLNWLAAAVEQDSHRQGAVVGFYLAKMWYHERLYPLVFAAGALAQAARQFEPQRHAVAPVS